MLEGPTAVSTEGQLQLLWLRLCCHSTVDLSFCTGSVYSGTIVRPLQQIP